MIKVNNILWTLIFALADVLLVLNVVNIVTVGSIIFKLLTELLISVGIFVVLILTYGKIFFKVRNMAIVSIETLILGSVDTFYTETPLGVSVHIDIVKMLLSILGVTTITITIRVINLGLEAVSRREFIPLILYALLILAPLARGMVYMIVYCTFFVFTQIIFVSLLSLKEERDG